MPGDARGSPGNVLPVAVGKAPPEPIVVPLNPDGTVTLSLGCLGRVVTDPPKRQAVTDGQMRARALGFLK